CGRTTSTTFQELAERIQGYVREKMPEWKASREGVEAMTLAVMGCVVNGPGESKAASIGISLPGTGEAPNCPVFIDGKHVTTLRGNYDELAAAFQRLVDGYVEHTYPQRCFPASRSPPSGVGLLRFPSAAARGDARHPRGARQRRRASDGRRQVAVLPGAGGRGRSRARARRLAADFADEGSGRRPARRRRRR